MRGLPFLVLLVQLLHLDAELRDLVGHLAEGVGVRRLLQPLGGLLLRAEVLQGAGRLLQVGGARPGLVENVLLRLLRLARQLVVGAEVRQLVGGEETGFTGEAEDVLGGDAHGVEDLLLLQERADDLGAGRVGDGFRDLQEEFFGIKEGKYEVPLYRALWAVMYGYHLFERYVRNYMPDEELEYILKEIFENWKLWRSELLGKYMQGDHSGDLELLHQIICLQKKMGMRIRKHGLSASAESADHQENRSETEPALYADGEILQAEQVIIQYIHDNIDRLRDKPISENDRWDNRIKTNNI